MASRLRRAAAIFALLPGLAGCGKSLVWYGKSPDRQHLAEIVDGPSGQIVRIDGREGQAYRGVGVETLSFTDDGRKVAYAAERKEGWVVVTEATAGSAAPTVSPIWAGIGEIAWSADGQHLAFAAERGGWRVVRDGREGPVFEAIFRGSMRWSADGKRLAYVAQRGEKSVVVDGDKVGEAEDGIASLTFSEDGQRLGYVARTGTSVRLVIDAVAGPVHPSILDFALSPRGRRTAYVALDDAPAAPGSPRHRWHTVVDGVAGPSADRIASIAFDPTGAHLAFVRRAGGKSRVVVDGAEGAPYDEIAALAFAPAGDRLSYAARRGDAWVVVDRGREGQEAQWIGALVHSADGERLGYLARRGGQGIVVHESEVTALEGALEGSLVFSRDGRHWACVVQPPGKGVLTIVIDGIKRIPMDIEELTAAVSRFPVGEAIFADRTDLLRRWVLGELELSLRAPPGVSSRP